MNLGGIGFAGFVATLVLTTIMSAAQGLGLSRMSVPFILGTMFTADRDRAAVLGFIAHLVNGWVFAFLYAAAFERWSLASWWLGGSLGLAHGLVILIAVLPLLPGLHPRMASETRGPEPTRALEPPGFMGLNYGRQTPIIALIAHVVYGAIIGSLYQVGGP